MRNRSAPHDIICGHCGGSDVSLDAWADWDRVSQQWSVRELFEQGYCHACGGETRLVERAILRDPI